MKYVFLINTFCIKEQTEELINRIKQVAEIRCIDYVIECNSKGYLTEEILKKYQDNEVIILPIGGDGTINRTLSGIVNTKNVLGYIPYGTGNDFYRSNKELLEQGINDIDLVKINNNYFINVACFGIDADIANNDDIIHSNIIPKSQRYNASIIKNFISYKPRHMSIKVNGEEYEDDFTTLAICNARYYGGGYKIGTDALLDDGLLDVYMVKDMSKLKTIKLLLGMNKGKHEDNSMVKVVKAKKLYVNCYKTISCNIDGEELTSRTFNVEVIPNGIKVYYDQGLIDDIRRVR